jgi:hypothetical protein
LLALRRSTCRNGLAGHRGAFFLGTRIEEAQKRPLPASGGAGAAPGAAPPPQTHRPGQLAAHIALGITWGGLVGGSRGHASMHRKGQLRVLGSPSALHSSTALRGPGPGGHRGGRAGRPRTRFFLRKALDIYLRALGTETGLWARSRQSPGPIRQSATPYTPSLALIAPTPTPTPLATRHSLV